MRTQELISSSDWLRKGAVLYVVLARKWHFSLKPNAPPFSHNTNPHRTLQEKTKQLHDCFSAWSTEHFFKLVLVGEKLNKRFIHQFDNNLVIRNESKVARKGGRAIAPQLRGLGSEVHTRLRA